VIVCVKCVGKRIDKSKNNIGGISMNSIRWESPFPYTLAFNLFKQHIEEISRAYWAFVPTANTIKSFAKNNLENDDADPKSFFLIPDEEDRHIAATYGDWKSDFSEYINYSRLNIIMMQSSCLETYLRTVVSLAFESKPGVIINCRDAVDGAGLLKRDITYGDMRDKSYRFTDAIDDVCRGEWDKRLSSFQKYFGTLPAKLLDLSKDLDELRITRNNIGHYFGRKKSEYEAPIDFKPIETMKVSHDRILKYFKLIYTVAELLDDYLHKNIIGSYDIIKRYFIAVSRGEIIRDKINSDAYQLKKMIGSHGLILLSKSYYNELITFCETNYVECETDCIFTKNRCVQEINRRLKDNSRSLLLDGRPVPFNSFAFKKILTRDNLFIDPRFSKRAIDNRHQIQYLHSSALIDYVTKKLESNANTIMNDLK